MNNNDWIIGVLYASFISGLIPLIVGLIKKETNLAIVGFVMSSFFGFTEGFIIGFPVAIIFIIIIMVNSKKKTKNIDKNETKNDIE